MTVDDEVRSSFLEVPGGGESEEGVTAECPTCPEVGRPPRAQVEPRSNRLSGRGQGEKISFSEGFGTGESVAMKSLAS